MGQRAEQTGGPEAAAAPVVHASRPPFDWLCREYFEDVRRYVQYLLRGQDGADVVQTVFLTARRSYDKLRDPQAAKPWLMGIVRNVVRAHVRKLCRERQHLEMLPDPSVLSQGGGTTVSGPTHDGRPFLDSSSENKTAWLDELMRRLPRRYAAVLLLRFIGDLSWRQVAWFMQLRTEDAARSLCRRALVSASELVGQGGGAPGSSHTA